MARKKTTSRKTTRSSKVKTDRISAAKAKADKAAPPAKRATHLAYPETADAGWAAGNPEQAKALEK
jgi:hypothetical protein